MTKKFESLSFFKFNITTRLFHLFPISKESIKNVKLNKINDEKFSYNILRIIRIYHIFFALHQM